MSVEKQTAIMTPVFQGTRYLHHICSECNGTLEFEQSCFGGASFFAISLEKCEYVKFCPLCGTQIERFSDKPIYIEPLDLKPLDVFSKLCQEYERKAKWLYHCYISDEHREKIKALIPLIQKDEIPGSYQKALNIAKVSSASRQGWQQIKKLKKEFGEEQE